jgi:hypothetical protein
MAKNTQALRALLTGIKALDTIKLRVRGQDRVREYHVDSVLTEPEGMPESGPTIVLYGMRGGAFKLFWSFIGERECVVLLSTGGERTRSEEVVALEFERGPLHEAAARVCEPVWETVGKPPGVLTLSAEQADQQAIDALPWPPGMTCRRVEQDAAVTFEVSDDWPSNVVVCETALKACKSAWLSYVADRERLHREAVEAGNSRIFGAVGLGWDVTPCWVGKGGIVTHPETDEPVRTLDDAIALVEFFARKYADDRCAMHDLHVAQDRIARLEKQLAEARAYEQVLHRIGSALGMRANASALEIGMAISLRLLGHASLVAASPLPTIAESWSTIGEQLAAAGYAHLAPTERSGKGKQP